jgi:cardiolipin synthase A/B
MAPVPEPALRPPLDPAAGADGVAGPTAGSAQGPSSPEASDEHESPSWLTVPAPRFVGGNAVELLEGGDALFPRMLEAIREARREVWLATYIFHRDEAAQAVMAALRKAAQDGVKVHVVVDGFGSLSTLASLRQGFRGSGVRFEVFRPLDRWWAWLQPGQLRRLHQKLCVCDAQVAFVGGVNIIDDRHDLNHGWTDQPRLDYAVAITGPLAEAVRATARAMWARARLGRGWREEVRAVVRSAAPVEEALAWLQRLRLRGGAGTAEAEDDQPVRAAFVVRDNLRQRRAIERSYVEAIRSARQRIDLAVPYFYPGSTFRRALRHAARRGVRVRLLLQGKVDYRIAALAAGALYDELRGEGIEIFEYTPAFLHAKVAVVDERWATVGSSNIDPLSLLLNLEANVVVQDEAFARSLTERLDRAFAVSRSVADAPLRRGWRGWLQRAVVAWIANAYLRVAGIAGTY